MERNPDILSLELVRCYMQYRGGKLPNSDLVKQFKKYLNDPSTKAEARLLFKDIVNTIATVQKEGNVKYLVLKPSYINPDQNVYEPRPDSPSPSLSPEHPVTPTTAEILPTPDMPSFLPNFLQATLDQGPPPFEEPPPFKPAPPPYQPPPPPPQYHKRTPIGPPPYQPPPSVPLTPVQTSIYIETPSRNDFEMRPSQIEFQTPVNTAEEDSFSSMDSLSHSQSSPNLHTQYEDYGDGSLESREMHHSSNDLLDPPQPPPRRKGCIRGKENRGIKIEEKLRQLNEDRDTSSPPRSALKEDLEKSLSPGMVKERAERLNQLSDETKVPRPMSSSNLFSSSSTNLNNLAFARRNLSNKNGDDDDNSSVSSMDPRRKEWIIRASKGDYHGLAKLLKEEPKLASYKDFISGFTALHWAAKHGNGDMIKLIAGSYKVNPNVRSNGGYTALHIAALFRHEEIMELLVNTYGADVSIRDHSGKRAYQYLPSSPYAHSFYPAGMQDERKPVAAGYVANHGTSNGSQPGQPQSLDSYLLSSNNHVQRHASHTVGRHATQNRPPNSIFTWLQQQPPSVNGTRSPSAAASPPDVPRKTSDVEGAKPNMSRGGFLRNSLHQSFLRAARPSIRKKLKYKANVNSP